MGLYDELHIDKSHLPENLKDHESGWQTKSYDCYLTQLTITDDGKLIECPSELSSKKQSFIQESDHTGEIRFYKDVDGVWHEFVAFFVNGQMLKLILVEPTE